MSRTALVIVDVQHDFLPGGALGVTDGDQVIEPLVRAAARPEVELVVASRDWHPESHMSFAENGGQWPAHCVAGTHGAEIHPAIAAVASRTISKGENPRVEQYSAAQATTLPVMLEAEGFDTVIVGGLATDYCVKATVLDLLQQGFKVRVLAEGCRAVNLDPGDEARAMNEMLCAGADIELGTRDEEITRAVFEHVVGEPLPEYVPFWDDQKKAAGA